MEEKIETVIDTALDSAAPQFYIANISIGVALIILGVSLLVLSKKPAKRKRQTIGYICIVVGVLAISGGLLQMSMSL